MRFLAKKIIRRAARLIAPTYLVFLVAAFFLGADTAQGRAAMVIAKAKKPTRVLEGGDVPPVRPKGDTSDAIPTGSGGGASGG